MSDIQNSQSIFFNWDTSLNRNTYTQRIPTLQFIPDVAIVRQIASLDQSPDLNRGQYYIWSSLRNDFIGSFNVANNSFTTSGATIGQSSFVSNPQSVISEVQGLSNSLSFQIQVPSASGMVNQSTLNGLISIQIEFLKFKKER